MLVYRLPLAGALIAAVAVLISAASSTDGRTVAAAPADAFNTAPQGAALPSGTDPLATVSTAFNVDYSLAWRRACYEGDFTWLNDAGKAGGYAAGDEWGCMGAWFAGDWYTTGARDYIARVRGHYDSQVWAMRG